MEEELMSLIRELMETKKRDKFLKGIKLINFVLKFKKSTVKSLAEKLSKYCIESLEKL
jgi:hypothetical protein